MSREPSVPKFFGTKTWRICAVLFTLAVIYGVCGFLIAPRMLRSAILDEVPKQTGAIAAVGEIRINPFLLQLELKDFSVTDAAGDRLLGFGRLFVDLGLGSLWHRAFAFKDIEIDAPFLNAIIASDGTMNLLKLKPKSQAPPKSSETPQSLPRIRIAEFRVTGGALSYEDRSVPSHFTTRLEPIAFDLRDFATDAQGGMFTFSGASKLGERFEWRGHLAVQPVESDGELRIQDLHAQTIGAYLADKLGFTVESGRIDVDAKYRFALRNAVELQVDLNKAALTDFSVQPKSAAADAGAQPAWIVVPSLTVTNGSFDLGARTVRVDAVALSGLKVLAWLEPDRSINLAKLAAPPGTPGAPGAAAPPVPAAGAASGAAPWTAQLQHFEIRDASISVQDRSTKPVASFLIAPLSLDLTGASLDFAHAVAVSLDATLNQTGRLNLSGDVTPQPLSADLALKLSGFELKALQPYIEQHTAMSVLDGHLNASANIAYGKIRPRVQVSASLSVDSLHTVDDRLHEDFVNWQRLDVQGISFQQDPDRLSIDRIAALKPYARVIIEADSTINVKRILAGPGASTAGSAAAEPQASPTPLRALDRAATRGSAPRSAESAAPFPLSVKSVELQSGRTNFSDLSINPNFSAGIEDLHGTVRGLNSQPNSRAQVDLHGQVDPFAPVAITGEVNLLSPALYTDLALSFRNIELSIFNPYSGKFAGYAISKGKLTTELHYKVDGRKLEATHHVSIDQLEFGEKTESKDAVSLPVKLAVALLKDRNGLIELDLPVDGSLDDPNFHLAPAIWKFLGNLLVKAVTAPFALLGSLFGGGPDLQFVEFSPGAAAVGAAGGEKLKAIVKALKERPQLKIEVPIAVLAEIDRPALLEARLAADLDAERALQTKPAAQKPGVVEPPPFRQLEPAAQLPVLAALYTKKLGHAPQFPEAGDGKPTKPEIAAAEVAYLDEQLRAQVVVDDADLKHLAEQRAQSLQQALLADGAIDPARVFLVASDKITARHGLVRLELSLQ